MASCESETKRDKNKSFQVEIMSQEDGIDKTKVGAIATSIIAVMAFILCESGLVHVAGT